MQFFLTSFTVVISSAFLSLVFGNYNLRVRLISYVDPKGEDINGVCCDGTCTVWSCTCPSACDLYYYLCVEPLDGGSTDVYSCTTGFKKTNVIQANHDSNTFLNNHQYGQWYNPSTYTFQGLWTGFYLKVRAYDQDDWWGGGDETVDLFYVRVTDDGDFAAGTEYTVSVDIKRKHASTTTLRFSFLATCSDGYSGRDCVKITTTTTTSSTTSTSTPTTTRPTSTTTTTTTPSTSTTTPSTTTPTTTATPTTTTPTTTTPTTSTTTPTTTSTTTTTTTTPPVRQRDCADWFKEGSRTTGIYTININGHNFQVYCDMDTGGGGWTLIQRRMDGSVEFHRNWIDYKMGFGDLSGNFWLGNDNIHYLTTSGVNKQLRVDLWDCSSSGSIDPFYEDYPEFKIDDEANGYRMHMYGMPSGSAENSLSYELSIKQDQNNTKFSTFDSDNDNNPDGNCALERTGGWWFNNCGYSNLNGVYHEDCCSGSPCKNGLLWFTLRFGYYSVRKSQMKIRPTDCC